MDYLAIAALVIHLVQAHWTTVLIIAASVQAMYVALQGKAYDKFFALAKELVVKVADEELSGPDKRKKVIDDAYVMLPLWAKALVTQAQAEVLAERAYQVLRGEMAKAPEPAPVVTPPVTSVDPTVPVVDEANMEVKSPIKIEE
jgi:hypothetical protein